MWQEGCLKEVSKFVGPVRVADSWRHADGRLRRVDLHQDRFSRGVREVAGIDPSVFMEAALALVPDSGEWFPRVRLVRESLVFDLRPGPVRRRHASVQVLAPGDPRSSPRVKGPDLELSAQLIARARELGAEEVLVRDEGGTVLEAGFAALVWWDGEDLCVPDPGLPVLASVTRALVEERARELGLSVRPVAARIEDLSHREAWLLSAYQGLRVVSSWVGADVCPGPPERAEQWRTWLDSQLQPLLT